MTQRSDNGRHGFILHDSCWCLLQKAFEPTSVSSQRLLEVCESLPFPLRNSNVCWGHDFGGLWAIDSRDAFPWEERFFKPRQVTNIFREGLRDPFNVPCIAELLTARTQLPFVRPLVKGSRDCFSSFPQEILDQIAILLDTKDALNLRSASASFLPLYISKYFWSSRFSADGERGFLFEAREPRGYVGWLTLYRLSSHSRCSAGLRNRQRIWNLIQMIRPILQRHRSKDLDVEPNENWAKYGSIPGSCDIHAGAEIVNWTQFNTGCRLFGTCTLNLPDDLMQVGVTTIDMGLCTYVTGLHFISRSTRTRVGYVAENEERKFMISNLYGLRLAMSPSGIRALQLIGKNGHCSQWAGDPTEVPISDRLVNSEPIRKLAVSYDVKSLPTSLRIVEPTNVTKGFKIVSLTTDVQKCETVPAPEVSDALMQAAWYPHVPSKRLCLNPSWLWNPCFENTGFRPFILFDFGGPEGKYLPYITGLSVQYIHRLHSIEVYYQENSYTCGSRKLGRCDTSEVPPSALFKIDGEAGERITAIYVAIDDYSPPPTVTAVLPQAVKKIRVSAPSRNQDRSENLPCLLSMCC